VTARHGAIASEEPERDPAGAGRREHPQRERRSPSTDRKATVDADIAAGFARVAPWYARYRPHYPDALFTHLHHERDLDRASRVADIGCGPGRIAIPLAASVAQVIGIDPVPAMLYQASREAARAGVGHRICWRQASAEDAARVVAGAVDLAVIASALDFTDAPAVLEQLKAILTDTGSVAIVNGGPHIQSDRAPWQLAADEVRRQWFGPTRSPARPARRTSTSVLDLLAQAGYDIVENCRFDQEIDRGIDSAVGLQYSWVSCDPHELGGLWPAFEADLRATLTAAAPGGVFTQHHRTELIIARPMRPSH
jgi:ubiquinone/menaquinone biosynthesis C-methylase UbiE